MADLFGSDESDGESPKLTINTEYAKNYDQWRRKEELNKLKTKYGENLENLADADDGSSSSSSDDDEEEQLEMLKTLDKDFFKTLASIKSKDPKIYDQNTTFFNNTIDFTALPKKKKEEKLFLKDYERKMLLEKGGIIEESDDEVPRAESPTLAAERKKIKDSLKKVYEGDSDEDDSDMLISRKKSSETEEDKIKADECKSLLLGKKDKIGDKDTEQALKPLKEFWSDPNLDEGEKYLKDYILNERFMEKNGEYIPSYDEVVQESDEELEEFENKQEEFEHKYNFRFEEPDQEFIKRYPRTMEHSLRKTDDRRKLKRQEVKERKARERKEKFEEMQQLEKMKKLEMQEKLEKLKEVVGNDGIAFDNINLDEDFDPDAHDKLLNNIFNDEFYKGEETDQKPEFPDLDEELEIEKWDKYDDLGTTAPHCEDEDFNMDCDYDPESAPSKEPVSKKKKRKRSKFAEAVSAPKPVFKQTEEDFNDYLSQYYNIERWIGDCNFKYSEVIPNNFGLTDEEILFANEKELNRWCSIKKTIQRRPEHVEKYDQIAFRKKAQNEALKKKILPSLYASEEKGDDSKNEGEAGPSGIQNEAIKKKRRRGKSKSSVEHTEDEQQNREAVHNEQNDDEANNEKINDEGSKEKVSSKQESKKKPNAKKKKAVEKPVKNKSGVKRKRDSTENGLEITDARLQAFGIKPKKFRNKLKYGNKNNK